MNDTSIKFPFDAQRPFIHCPSCNAEYDALHECNIPVADGRAAVIVCACGVQFKVSFERKRSLLGKETFTCTCWAL